ncbi:MAG: hypothetical protein SWH68_01720 [Thermodesulfobacteriota bacterium]|nr:hypothetical protein [Thermodesulfobacteriota bacterium]
MDKQGRPKRYNANIIGTDETDCFYYLEAKVGKGAITGISYDKTAIHALTPSICEDIIIQNMKLYDKIKQTKDKSESFEKKTQEKVIQRAKQDDIEIEKALDGNCFQKNNKINSSEI